MKRMNINKKTFPNPYKRREALRAAFEDIIKDITFDERHAPEGHKTDPMLVAEKKKIQKEIRKWHKDFVNLDNHENCWIYPDCLSNHPHVAGEPVWEAPPSGMDGCLWQQESPTRFGSR